MSSELNHHHTDFLLLSSDYHLLEAYDTIACERLPNIGSSYPSTSNTIYPHYLWY
jgi:hypothetical protein